MGGPTARTDRTNDAGEGSPATTSTDLVWAVVRLRTALRNEVRRETTLPQLDEAERDLMVVLWDHGGLGLSEAARRAVLPIPAARRAADGLSRRGLVLRRTNAFDPSGIILEPTTAAETRMSDGMELSSRIMARGMESLDEGELALMPEVVSALEELTTRLEDRVTSSGPSLPGRAPEPPHPQRDSPAVSRLTKITAKAEERARDQNPLGVLAAAGDLISEVRAFEFDLVHDLRSQGYSWQKIADTLGISKQTAHARYAAARRT